MPNLNKVMLIGHLTRDVESRYTPKGTALANIGLAVSRKWKDEAGQAKEEVAFIDCEVWGRTAELASQYLAKGKAVFFEGRLKLDQWDDKESGQKRSKLKVVVESMQFLGARDDQPRSESAPQPRAATPAAQPETDDSQIPF
jgi:single-strand DNA-binding protein